MALGVSGRLRPRIFSTFGTTRVAGRQPKARAAFTSGEIPGTHFQKLSRPQGTWFCRKEPRKNSQVTPPGIDPGTVRLVAPRLNHYSTPGPKSAQYLIKSALHENYEVLTYIQILTDISTWDVQKLRWGVFWFAEIRHCEVTPCLA